MITCEFREGRVTCSREAVITVAVKRGNKVLSLVNVCDPHLHTARYEAMDLSARKGGRVSVLPIVPVVRATKADPLVNVGAVIPRSEFDAMVLVAQSLRMSQRAFVRWSINNQVHMAQLKGKGDDDDRQA